MKKKQLLQAMKSLPMLAEDKEKFVNIILDNSGGGSQDDIRYYRVEVINSIENEEAIAMLNAYIDVVAYNTSGNKGIINYYLVNQYDTTILAVSVNFNKPMAEYMEGSDTITIFNNIFEGLVVYGMSEYIDIINNLPTITREEFINLVKQ